MPTFGSNQQQTAGQVSDNLFADTIFNNLNQGSTIRLNLATVAANDGLGTANVNQTFSVGNTEYASQTPLPALITGQPFSDNGAYKENEITITQAGGGIPSLRVTNGTAGNMTFKYKIFVSQQ